MEKINVLLVEDDINLGSLLKQYLTVKGYLTDLYDDGEKGYQAFLNKKYDLCLLDIMMPRKDGFSLAQDIRLVNQNIPIIFLTAKSLKEDVLEGFKLGADDYLTKPFNMDELLVRMEAVLRRTAQQSTGENKAGMQSSFQLGQYTFDTNKQSLTHATSPKNIKLTTKEAELLKMLCLNKNRVLERNLALKTIWSDDNYFNARSMDVYITKLRKHLKADTGIEIINVHGKGYKLVVPE